MKSSKNILINYQWRWKLTVLHTRLSLIKDILPFFNAISLGGSQISFLLLSAFLKKLVEWFPLAYILRRWIHVVSKGISAKWNIKKFLVEILLIPHSEPVALILFVYSRHNYYLCININLIGQ